MRADEIEELARQALRESNRTDCQLVSVAPREGSDGSWTIDLLDVMQKQEPFRVCVETTDDATDEEVKETIRRGIAEHFSASGY